MQYGTNDHHIAQQLKLQLDLQRFWFKCGWSHHKGTHYKDFQVHVSFIWSILKLLQCFNAESLSYNGCCICLYGVSMLRVALDGKFELLKCQFMCVKEENCLAQTLFHSGYVMNPDYLSNRYFLTYSGVNKMP